MAVFGLGALGLSGCQPATTAPSGSATPPPPGVITADMIAGEDANAVLESTAESAPAPAGTVVTQEMIAVEESRAGSLTLALPAGFRLPEEVKARIESAMAGALEQSSFTLKLVEIPIEGGPAKLLEDGGQNAPGLMLAPRPATMELAASGQLREFSLAEWMYLGAPGAKVADREKASATAPTAAEAEVERLPDNYFDPNRSPELTAAVAEPSQGEYAPFLFTALGLAAPGASSLDLDSWRVLFTPEAGAPRLVREAGSPEIFAASLLSMRKSPNSILPADFRAGRALIAEGSPSYVAAPAGYPVTEALSEGALSLALVYGRELTPNALVEKRVRFAIPREGSIRITYDLVVPKSGGRGHTAELLMALLWRPETTADLAEALGMTPALNPAARKLLAEKSAPLTCLLPETRQYYEGENSQAQKTARLDVEKELRAILDARASALPEIRATEDETAMAATPTPETEPLPAFMGPPPAPEAEVTPGADSAEAPPAMAETAPSPEPAPVPAEEKPVETATAPVDGTSLSLPGPEEMPAPES